MPQDPSTDPDFLKASPSDQMAYLKDTDPDFAAASPQDQLGYLFHLRGLNPTLAGPAKGAAGNRAASMQQDPWGIQDNPNQAGAGLPGMTGNRPVTNADLAPGAVAGGAAAIGATAGFAGPPLARFALPYVVQAGNWAEANPMTAKLLLEAAKATGYGAAVYKGLKKVTK